MIMNKSTIGRKTNGIAVKLRKQAVLSICMDALKEWRVRTEFGPCTVTLINGLEDNDIKVWLDARLFKRALIGLLEASARRGEIRQGISFSINSNGLSFCRVTICYSRKMRVMDTDNEEENIRLSGKILEIISQHRGKIEIAEEKYRGRLLIQIPC